jgi:hypothetical protein
MHFEKNEGRLTGASMTGIVGETKLATLVFRCISLGISPLELSVEVFADATPDNPRDITEDVTEGAIACVEPGAHYGTLEVESRTMLVGETERIIARAYDIPELGLEAWTFDIGYDASIVSVDECFGLIQVEGGWRSVCRRDYAPETIRVTGTSSVVFTGDWLANIEFKCERAGVSDLPVSIRAWGYVTTDFGPPPPDVIEGSITCVEPQPVLPPTGGGAGSGSLPLWPFVALAAFGAGTAAAGVVAARRRDGLR